MTGRDKKQGIVWDLLLKLCSRWGIVIQMAVLLGLSLLGAIIPQQSVGQHQQWTEKYPLVMKVAGALGVDRIYGSWLFLAVLGVVCLSGVISILMRLNRLRGASDGSWVARVISRRRIIGSLVFHAGLLGIVVTGILSGRTRAQGNVIIAEKQTVGINPMTLSIAGPNEPMAFHLRLDKFLAVHEGSWGTSDYASKVTVIEEGREARTFTIGVNNPLKHRKLEFYQQLHGFAPLIKVVKDGRPQIFAWVNLSTEFENDSAIYSDSINVPMAGLQLDMRLYPDVVEENGVYRTKSPDPNNCMIYLKFRERGKLIYEGPAYMGQELTLENGSTFLFSDICYWSEFDVIRDRGAWPLFVCSWVAVAGLCIRFMPSVTGSRGEVKEGENAT